MDQFLDTYQGLLLGLMLVIVALLALRFPQLLPTYQWQSPEGRSRIDLGKLRQHTLHGYILTAFAVILANLLPLPAESASVIRMLILLAGVITVTYTGQRYVRNQPLSIGPKQPGEEAEIHRFIQKAFLSAKVTDGKEQEFADQLRTSEGYIPGLELVARTEQGIVGHIMLTHYKLGDQTSLLLLAPLSVAEEMRGRGLGALLIQEAFRRARESGYTAVVLMGDPAYYRRFGFRQSSEFGIRCTNDIPAQYTQALELTPGALRGLDTTITF